MRRAVLACLAVLAMTASISVRERRAEKALERAASVDRVDMGVTLHVVRQRTDGEKVTEPTPDVIVRTHHLGGMVQIGGAPVGWNRAKQGDPPRAFYCGPSESPVVWMCSVDQEPLILHDNDPKWTLIQGSEGAGKTVVLVMWSAVRVLENVGRRVTGGLSIPTGPRFRAVREEIDRLWPSDWYRWRDREHRFVFHAGPRIQIVSAVQKSKKSGSGLQGDSLEWCASDEMQDHFALEADIMSRGRGSRRYLRLCTSTSKDLTEWRDHRTKVQTSPLWTFKRMIGLDSPFVARSYWDEYRASGTVTEREWRRRILAEDVGPERQVYFTWKRSHANDAPANLAPIPNGAVDVTARELRPWGRNVTVLAGHDPGLRQHVTVFLKAYEIPGKDKAPRWFVVGEVTSPESTIHSHVQAVKETASKRWACIPAPDRFGQVDPTAATMLVRIDPATQAGEDHPGEDVFRAWRVAGLQAKPANYAPGTTRGSPLKKRQRIDLLNTLMCATATVGEVRRLFVEMRDGKPVAPMLVKALETMETNEAGKAEAERKDADDLSHWPAAVGFALWLIESRRLKWEPDEVAA